MLKAPFIGAFFILVRMIDLEFYSPIEPIFHPLFTKEGLNVFIKRDDLIHPFISGNKWRKLKYLLQKAESQKKKHLVTFGGAWSNHLLATACAAAKFGFTSTGIVRGEEIQNDVLFLCRLFGMQLHFVDRESYRDKKSIFKRLFDPDPSAFFINEGGASAEAVEGCAELVSELEETYDHVFCACGTGTTAAGIINGLAKNHYSALFNGISVLKGGDFIGSEIKKYTQSDSDFVLHTEYHFGGYAKTTPQLLEFIKRFSSTTGILLDPIYTGKMMHALFNLAEKNYFKKGQRILAIHTGGLFGLLGMSERF